MSRYDDDREAMEAAEADPRYRDIVRQDDDERVPPPEPTEPERDAELNGPFNRQRAQ